MPVTPAKFLQTSVRNGVGSFVRPCSKITLRFCNWGGSSQGMREFLRTELREVASENPSIEFVVLKKTGHPLIQGEYAGGLTKSVCVRNLEPSEILKKFHVVRDASGNKLKKYQRAVDSSNTSVRGIWSPFHVEKPYRYRI